MTKFLSRSGELALNPIRGGLFIGRHTSWDHSFCFSAARLAHMFNAMEAGLFPIKLWLAYLPRRAAEKQKEELVWIAFL